jgi:hypothetical protein
MTSAAKHPDGAAARPQVFDVVVERSGGVTGMLRRWSAPVPDDGGPAARAAQRIAQLGAQRAESQADRRAGAPPSTVRDTFVWSVICGNGSLQCDEAARRRDPDVDALIIEVTGSGRPA